MERFLFLMLMFMSPCKRGLMVYFLSFFLFFFFFYKKPPLDPPLFDPPYDQYSPTASWAGK